jgi:shikimate dehydrogenase
MTESLATGSDLMTDGRGRQVLVGLLGQGISASRTPRMHMEEGRAQNLRYDYRLLDMAATPDRPVAEILAECEAQGFNGLNVTFPYKKAVIPLLTALSRNAQAVGSVNTIVFRDGGRHGHNTDYFGFAESFRRGLGGAARDQVLLIGAGGAGRAVAHALAEAETGTLQILDTDRAVAEDLASSIEGRFGKGRAEVAQGPEVASAANGLVNTSPVGMNKMPGLPIAAEFIRPDHWVADIVYFPLETAFLAVARAKGCAVLPGSGMAIHQAVRAFELFTGFSADPARMQATFDAFDMDRGI